MDLIISAFTVLHLLYLSVILLVLAGLLRLRRVECEKTPFVSVVISARNEEKRILPTLQSLERLNYPSDRYEIIIVDDASVDRTAEYIRSFTEKHDNWSLISLTDKSLELRGKKKALKEAIRQARGDYIFTTDADCIVPENWIRRMVCYFRDDTSMVLGHSPLMERTGFLNRILCFDNLFSVITAAAPAKLGFAMTSVGRNLAYRKTVYEDIGGFDALKRFKSGDDVHLTERFREKGKGKIDFCAHPETYVFTPPPTDRKQFFHQQVRKNSKTLNKSLPSVFLSLVLFVYHALLILLPIFDAVNLNVWFAAVASKFLLEYLVLLKAALIFKKRSLVNYLFPMQFIYPVYIIFFSLLGILQIYEWKK